MIVKIRKIEIATKSKVDLSIEACKKISISCDFLENFIKIQFQNDELKKGRADSAINHISKIRESTKYLPYEYDANLPNDIKHISTEDKVKTIQLLLDNLANDFDALVNGEPKKPELDRLLDEIFQSTR